MSNAQIPPRPLAAKGDRPFFLDNPDCEKLFNMVVALTGEVSVLREQVATLSALTGHTEAMKNAPPPANADADRKAMLERVYRILLAENEGNTL